MAHQVQENWKSSTAVSMITMVLTFPAVGPVSQRQWSGRAEYRRVGETGEPLGRGHHRVAFAGRHPVKKLCEEGLASCDHPRHQVPACLGDLHGYYRAASFMGTALQQARDLEPIGEPGHRRGTQPQPSRTSRLARVIPTRTLVMVSNAATSARTPP